VQTFTLDAADYQIFVIGQAQAGGTAGLFGATVRSVASGAAVFSKTVSIGDVADLGSVTLAAGAHTVTLSDFAFPTALTQSGVVVVRDGVAAAGLSSPGNTSFTASGGAYEVFAYAGGNGSYGVEVRQQGGASVFASAQSVGGTPGTTATYAYPVDVATAGSYRIRLTDFEFPGQLAALSLAASQGGALTGSLTSPGNVDVNLVAGRVYLLVAAKPAASGGALFGVNLTPSAGGAAVFETTQGVGSLFSVRKVSIATAGQYNVTLTDLQFPNQFADLAAVVTRGAERAGSIFGGGTFSFAATPGDYFVNFVAQGNLIDQQISTTAKAGTYAMSVASAPPAPTITLSTNPTQVKSGGTVTLTWSTTNATSCSASGGWTGTKAAQGTETSAAITTSTTYKLTCSGPGGTTDQSVSVGITTSTSGGGGGSMEWLTLAALMMAWQRSVMRGGSRKD
jgi:hypothetical protein